MRECSAPWRLATMTTRKLKHCACRNFFPKRPSCPDALCIGTGRRATLARFLSAGPGAAKNKLSTENWLALLLDRGLAGVLLFLSAFLLTLSRRLGGRRGVRGKQGGRAYQQRQTKHQTHQCFHFGVS